MLMLTLPFFSIPEELTSSGTLKVTPSREPMFTRKLDILEVIEGRTARFDCKVSGMPPPKVTWNHFGESNTCQTFHLIFFTNLSCCGFLHQSPRKVASNFPL